MNELEFFFTKFNLTEKQKKQYETYYELIYEYNQKMNLTGIDDRFGVYLKHFYDSLLITKNISENIKEIADLGSGAGFPGLVLAIYYPNKKITLIEPLTKRCTFLNIVIDKLGLENVTILNKRAEEVGKEQYDMVVARAVTRLNILLELSIPLIKVNGYLIAQKGPKVQEEIEEAKNALKTLDSSVYLLEKEILPIENSDRYNLVVKKNKETLKLYPRNFGQIKKNPL